MSTLDDRPPPTGQPRPAPVGTPPPPRSPAPPPQTTGDQRRREARLPMRTRIAIISAFVVIIVITIFSVQNTQKTDLRFLFWTKTAVPVFGAILFSFVLGFVPGWILGILRPRHRGDTGKRFKR